MMDELDVPQEEWRFRQRVEELFRGDQQVIYAVRNCNYWTLRRLLEAYAAISFSATEVLVAYGTNTDAASTLRRRALRAQHAPLMMERCEQLLRRRGPVCPVCGKAMSPAGDIFVCEGCGGMHRPDDGRGTENSWDGGDFGGDGSGSPAAPSEVAAVQQREYDDGNGMLVSS